MLHFTLLVDGLFLWLQLIVNPFWREKFFHKLVEETIDI